MIVKRKLIETANVIASQNSWLIPKENENLCESWKSEPKVAFSLPIYTLFNFVSACLYILKIKWLGFSDEKQITVMCECLIGTRPTNWAVPPTSHYMDGSPGVCNAAASPVTQSYRSILITT